MELASTARKRAKIESKEPFFAGEVFPLAYSWFTVPKEGDFVLVLADPKQKLRVLLGKDALCACSRCREKRSVGQIELKQKGAFSRKCVSASDIARATADTNALHRASSYVDIKAAATSANAKQLGKTFDSSGACCSVCPLHLILETCSDAKSVLAVFSADPSRAQQSYASLGYVLNVYPLHVAIRGGHEALVISALLDAFPQAATMPDESGVLPLHAAIKHGSSDAVIATLLRTCPAAAARPYPFPVALDPKRTLERATTLAAALITRRADFGALRCTSKAGTLVADALEARAAPLAIIRSQPHLLTKLSDNCYATLPLTLASSVAPKLKEFLLVAHVRAWQPEFAPLFQDVPPPKLSLETASSLTGYRALSSTVPGDHRGFFGDFFLFQ